MKPLCTESGHTPIVDKVLSGGEGPDDAGWEVHCSACGCFGWKYCDGTYGWRPFAKRRMDDDPEAMRKVALGTVDRRHAVAREDAGHAHVWGFHPTANAQCAECKTVTVDLEHHEAMDAVIAEAAKFFTHEGGDTYKLQATVKRVHAMRAVYRGVKGAKWPGR